MKLIKCKVCGGELEYKDNLYHCTYCKSVFKDDDLTIDEAKHALKLAIDEKEQQEIQNTRRNLFIELNKEYLSSEEIKKYADKLKSYYADDIFGNFFSLACSENLSALSDFMLSTDWQNIHYSQTKLIIEFLLKSPYLFKKNIPTIFADIIDKIYLRTSEEWQNYYSQFVTIMKNIDSGFFDVSLSRDIFVAYSSKDQQKVIDLVNYLENQGFRCFVAFRNLQHGSGAIENYETDLSKAIDNCQTFLFVSSTNSRNINCDALSVEMEYVTSNDVKNFPPEFLHIDYKKVPLIYKKPRVEFIIEDYNGENYAGEIRSNRFFAGLERTYKYEELVERLITIRNSTRKIPKEQPTPTVTKILSVNEKVEKNVRTFLSAGEYDKATKTIEIALNNDRYGEFANNLYLDMAEIYVQKDNYTKAQKIIDEVELNVPELAKIYILRLLIKLNFNTNEDLILSPNDLNDYPEFKKALKYAKGDYLNELKTYEFSVLENLLASAKKEREHNNFDKAIEIFKKCNGYKDSQAEILETTYQKGLYTKDNDSAKAIEIFSSCIDYKDSKEQIDSIHYSIAKMKLAMNKYTDAIKEFEICLSYKDSKEQIQKCYEQNYQDALKLKNKKEYQKAIKTFGLFPDYSDSKEQIEKCYEMVYKSGIQNLENKKYDDAINNFDFCKNYSDSKELIKECYYQKGKMYLYNKDFDNAEKIFAKIPNYKDSTKLANERNNYIKKQEKLKKIKIFSIITVSVCLLLVFVFPFMTMWETETISATECKIVKHPVIYGSTIKIPKKIKGKTVISIGTTFRFCDKLTSIIIPDSVTSIDSEAFESCTSLTSITIPNSVTSIGAYAFYNCSSLTSITIPNSVTSIGIWAFRNCSSLTSITIPNSVTSIGQSTFYNCSSLTSITIPNSVTSIDWSAFNTCTSLTSINFNGTKAQWNSISKGSYWNSGTGNYTIYCTDGNIKK